MECEELGGRYKELQDRHFILMDADTGKVVTGRQFPKLLAIATDVHGGTLFLTCENRSFELNLEEVLRRNEVKYAESTSGNYANKTAKIGINFLRLLDGIKQEGLDCGNQITEFLRFILGTNNNIRVLYFTKNVHIERDGLPEEGWHNRIIDPVIFPNILNVLKSSNFLQVVYPDECPYMVVCESSLDHLNSLLNKEDHVDMRYLRPVIAVSGAKAYDEDVWSELKINDVTFTCSIPCSRCVLVNIDPDTGIPRRSEEPLKTLRRYRLPPPDLRLVLHQSPIFGRFMGVNNKGTIRVGDPIFQSSVLIMLQTWQVVVPALVGGAACTAVALYIYQKRCYNALTEFVEVGTVSKLNIYPVKSMRAVSVDEMLCTKLGGECKELKDRHFMLYDGNTGKFFTGRQIPKLVTITANVEDNMLKLTSVVQNAFRLYDGLKQEGLDCGDGIQKFFSQLFDVSDNIRLLYFKDNLYSERDVIPSKSWLLGFVPNRCDRIAYVDDVPFMAMCESSVADLNTHLDADNQVDMRYFRPSIQISGPPAYDEDLWAEMRISNVTFSCYKPCVRCVMTTINPDTGIRRESMEPLKTLRTYRLAPGKLRNYYKESPVFGVDMGVNNTGTIKVGDVVYVRYKTHRC
uniref:MOSC domain-containing protein n=1 Tax=Syphacia muris TaxID=451379 RepID=A0A0N5AGT1_9BILA